MSKVLIDKLLDEAYKVANDAFGRGVVDKALQEVTVSRHNLAQAYKEAFAVEHNKEFPNMNNPFEDDTVFFEAALKGLNALDKHLLKRNTVSNYKKPRTRNTIVFTQPSHIRTPYTVMKKAGVEHLQKALATLKRAPLSEGQITGIENKIHKLHGETTAGTARLAYTLNHLKQSNMVNRFFTSLQYTRIQNKYGDLSLQFESIDQAKGKPDILKAISIIKLTVAGSHKNFAGSDHNDWTNIKPKLLKELYIWAKKHNWADQKGSPSVRDKAAEKLKNSVLRIFDKSKNTKVTGITKPVSFNRKPQSKRYKANRGKAEQKLMATTRISRLKAHDTSGNVLALHALLEINLQATLIKNMVEPRLVNRIGTFVKSVDIVSVSETRGGYPRVDYRFDHYPYDVFDFAKGTEPWNTPDRDPNTLIDASIREITRTIVKDKFRLYTRRVE